MTPPGSLFGPPKARNSASSGGPRERHEGRREQGFVGREDRRAAGLRRPTRSCTGRAPSRTTSSIVRKNPQGHAQRVPAALRHDPHATGPRSTSTTRRSSSATTSSRTRCNGGADAIFGLDIPLMRLVQRLQGRGRRATAPRSASSCCTARSARRSRRSRACSRRASRSTRARPRARSTPSTGSTSTRRGLDGHRRHETLRSARCTRSRCASSRTEWRAEAIERARPLERASYTVRDRRRARPGLPLRLQGPDDAVRAATGPR